MKHKINWFTMVIGCLTIILGFFGLGSNPTISYGNYIEYPPLLIFCLCFMIFSGLILTNSSVKELKED